MKSVLYDVGVRHL